VSLRRAVRVIVTYSVHSRPAKRYTPEHEVIKFDDETGVGTVSITDYAQQSLGDVVFVELPEQGAKIEQGGELSSFVCPGSQPAPSSYRRDFGYIESVGAVESVKSASDIVRATKALLIDRVFSRMSFQYAPVSGDVVGINEELGNQPSLLNKFPEDEGELLLHPHMHQRRRSLRLRLAIQT
jgi:glycine cleavage system H protein